MAAAMTTIVFCIILMEIDVLMGHVSACEARDKMSAALQ